jgi:cysteine dioxygenase
LNEQKKDEKMIKVIGNKQKKIHSLNLLISALKNEQSTKYHDILHSMEIPKSAFEFFCSWSESTYTRNCIFENERFELILICWQSSQKTPIHDHGGEECWVKFIDGEFKETIYKSNEVSEVNIQKSTLLKAGDISYMIDFMGCHQLKNLSNQRALSLHLYAKPIRSCNIYDEQAKEFVQKKMSYHTISSGTIS